MLFGESVVGIRDVQNVGGHFPLSPGTCLAHEYFVLDLVACVFSGGVKGWGGGGGGGGGGVEKT